MSTAVISSNKEQEPFLQGIRVSLQLRSQKQRLPALKKKVGIISSLWSTKTTPNKALVCPWVNASTFNHVLTIP